MRGQRESGRGNSMAKRTGKRLAKKGGCLGKQLKGSGGEKDPRDKKRSRKERVGGGGRRVRKEQAGRALLERAASACRAVKKVELSVSTPADRVASTPRLVEVCQRFGVPMTVAGRQVVDGLDLELRPGTITLVTGPSGSGKSLLLGELAKQVGTARVVGEVPFPRDVAVLDAVAPRRPMGEALADLTAAGLGEPMLWIRRFEQLSEGERFRARLARAVSLQRRSASWAPLICDEFGAVLHRRLAKALASNMRQLASREGLCLVLATSQTDLEGDLQPEQVVRLGGDEPVVEQNKRKRKVTVPRLSFARQLRIERGTIRDYQAFSGMHYRKRDNLGYVDKVFVARERGSGQLLGIVVYGHCTLELALRNRVTCRRYVRRPRLLNKEMRVLKRLVVHPDVRGCGMGRWLVQRTLPEVGTRFVECLAAMGLVNPVFEKAGMRRIGICQVPGSQRKTVQELRRRGVDPLGVDFFSQVRRRPAVRRLVAGCVDEWYQAVTAGGAGERINKQTPTSLAQTFRQLVGSEPVYYLWARDADGWALMDRGLGACGGEGCESFVSQK